MSGEPGENDGVTVLYQADDGSVPGANDEERLAYMQSRQAFEVCAYYGWLHPFTFATHFIELPIETAKAWRLWNMDVAFQTPEQRTLFDALQRRVDAAIAAASRVSPSRRAFVRLSTRSPKDAVDKCTPRAALVACLRRHLRAVGDEQQLDLFTAGDAATFTSHDGLVANARLIAVRRCLHELSAVASARQAFAVLKHSVRAVSDLRRALATADKLPFRMQLIVREFVPLPVDFELRAFVYDGRITALTQYYDDMYVPAIAARHDFIKATVAAFFDRFIKDLLRGPYTTCVIDFVVFLQPDGQPQQLDHPDQLVRVVELNPFLPTTGTGLFSWKTDMPVLTGKTAEPDGSFEFRFLFAPTRHVRKTTLQWDTYLDEAIKSSYPRAVIAIVIVLIIATLAAYFWQIVLKPQMST